MSERKRNNITDLFIVPTTYLAKNGINLIL